MGLDQMPLPPFYFSFTVTLNTFKNIDNTVGYVPNEHIIYNFDISRS